MARIELRGKYAIGEHRFALVDDSDFAWLNGWSWKAKWNAGRNNIYAIRTQRVDGKSVDIRMHREVLGLKRGDLREVDHKDHFGLNNQRANLRVATRSENILNARRVALAVRCTYCGVSAQRVVSATGTSRVAYCSFECAESAQHAPHSAVSFQFCRGCSKLFTARQSDAFWCSEACRARSKYHRRLSLRQRVLLSLDEPRSPSEIAEQAEAHQTEVRRCVSSLLASGLVVVVAKQRNGHRGRFSNVYAKASVLSSEQVVELR